MGGTGDQLQPHPVAVCPGADLLDNDGLAGSYCKGEVRLCLKHGYGGERDHSVRLHGRQRGGGKADLDVAESLARDGSVRGLRQSNDLYVPWHSKGADL